LSMIATQLSLTPAPIDQSSQSSNAKNATSDGGDGFAAQLARVNSDSSDRKTQTQSDQSATKESDSKGQSPTVLSSLLAALGDDQSSSSALLGQDAKATTSGSQTASSTVTNATLNNVVMTLAEAQAAAQSAQTDKANTSAPKTQIPAANGQDTAKANDQSDALAALLSLAKGTDTTSKTTSDTSTKTPSRQSSRSTDASQTDTTTTTTTPSASFQDLALTAQAALNTLAPSFASASKGVTSGQGSSSSSASSSSSSTPQIAAGSKDGSSSKLGNLLGLNMPTQATAIGDAAATDTSSTSSPVEFIKMDVSRIQAETHLIPAPAAPAQQIADAIVGSGLPTPGSSTTDASAPSGATDTTSQSQVSGPQTSTQTVTSPLKILTLTLEPESLGSVTITMRLNDSGLNVQLDAAQASTASMIEQDKSKITDKLQSLGYSVDGVDVKTAVTVQKMDQSSQGSLNDQSGSTGQQARQDAASSFSSGSGSNRNDQAPTDSRHESRQSLLQDETASSTRSGSIGDGLYV